MDLNCVLFLQSLLWGGLLLCRFWCSQLHMKGGKGIESPKATPSSLDALHHFSVLWI